MNSDYFSPKEENKFTTKLIRLIDSEFLPEQIPIIKEEYSEYQNCFGNVDKKIKIDNGKAHYGWAIFQSSILCEAERHAVWETENGDLIDITPREDDMKQIMFVSDQDFQYTGQIIDNLRINITQNNVVDDFIKICQHLSKLYSLGERKDDYSLNVHPELGKMINEYEQLKFAIENYIKTNNTEKKPCLCGGKKNYKNCHRNIILKNMPEDLRRIKKIIQE